MIVDSGLDHCPIMGARNDTYRWHIDGPFRTEAQARADQDPNTDTCTAGKPYWPEKDCPWCGTAPGTECQWGAE